MKNKLTGWCAGVTLAVTLASGVARAETESSGVPGEWLSRYSSARTLGLGGAFVATADDPLGALWNPAGLSLMYRDQLSFENARLFEETSVNALSFAVPSSFLPSFGVSMVSLNSGEFQKTNELNDALGTFREGETAYLFTLAKSLSPGLAIGTNVKLVQQTVESFSGEGFGFDLGAVLSLTPAVRVGAAVTNLCGPSVKLREVVETYPTE